MITVLKDVAIGAALVESIGGLVAQRCNIALDHSIVPPETEAVLELLSRLHKQDISTEDLE